MINWLHYLVEANIYLSVFYLCYCLFLNKETYYMLNRVYLLFSCVASFVLPMLQIGILKPVEMVTQTTMITTALPANVAYSTMPVQTAPVVEAAHLTVEDGIVYAYLLGAAILMVLLIVKLYKLLQLSRAKPALTDDGYKLIYIEESNTAFSFFNYLFIGKTAPGAETIIRHELVHIRQKHSVDIILLELFKVVNWFNPLIYLLQNSLKTIHEYIADEQTAATEADAFTYSSFLVNNAYGISGSPITNSFFNYNLLKKRIIMLNQQRSGSLARLKYLLAVPLCAALLCVSTLSFSKTYGWVDLAPTKVKSANKAYLLNLPKKKRLKITQNGITTITDKFSVLRNNKQIFYTANTLSKNDQSFLLKNDKIKVEVVDTTFGIDGKLPLPVINVDGYQMLDHYLHKSIRYRSATDEKGGLVVVGFTLDKDRKITDAKIVKSGGSKLDALALNGFKSYHGIVNDDSGKNYRLSVYFFTNDYSIFNNTNRDDPEFAGELIITNYDYAPTVTNKGYEYDESISSYPGSGTIMRTNVVIYEKNNEPKWYLSNTATPADIKLLKEKYGYVFPTHSHTEIYLNPVKDDAEKPKATALQVTSYLDAPYANEFYNSIFDNTKYPKKEKDELTAGLVVLNFNLDNNGTIGNISVSKSGGADFDETAVNALRSYKGTINDKAGQHSIAIAFCVVEKKIKPVVSENLKKDGYVGEIAISDVVSPFKSSVNMSPQQPVSWEVSDSISRLAYNNFHAQLSKTIRYPAKARENNITGKVYASFNVDANHKIQDVGVLQAPSEALANEVIRALKACDPISPTETNVTYVMIVNFSLAGYNGPAITNQSVNMVGKMPAKGTHSLALSTVIIVGYGANNK